MSNKLISNSHLDLVTNAGVATLSTLSPDQSIQSSLFWFDWKNDHIRINVVDGSAKAKNLRRQPKATLLIMDSDDTDRYLSLRCEVGMFERNGHFSPGWFDETKNEPPALVWWGGNRRPG